MIDQLRKEIEELRKELWHQWEYNHSEHCGIPLNHDSDGNPLPPHDGYCHWPLPDILNDHLAKV